MTTVAPDLTGLNVRLRLKIADLGVIILCLYLLFDYSPEY